jgi:hypothetical protein
MGQPNPPGDIPLYDGLGAEWNDIVGALPEDRRNELAPKLKERLDAYTPLKEYEEFQKAGISKTQIYDAVNLFDVIEKDPRMVYDTLAKHLGISPQEVKQATETMEETVDEDDPRIRTMQQQLDTLSQIALAQRQEETQSKIQADAEAQLESELSALHKKYGDVNEEEIVMRMLAKGIDAEQAYNEFTALTTDIRRRPPAPQILGGGGTVPARAIDPTKLDSAGTKNLVAQMMMHANAERKQ